MSDLDHTDKFDWQGRKPVYVELDELTDQEKELLTNSESFCMMPWVHMHGYPDGRAYPCCIGDYDHHIGDLNTQSMQEVWNDEPLKEMRRNMIAGKKCKQCTTCYENEGYDNRSMRQNSNKHLGKHIGEVLPATHEDGTADVFKLRYYDIRFSNLCNMSCRTCGDTFSNIWTEENKKRFGWAPDTPGVIYCGRNETDMLEQLIEHLPYVEHIYFAGGEPLIMPEHYQLVQTLVERELFHVELSYNTNFSKLEYGKGNDILEDWKRFDSVSIGASLDAMGSRAEYMRKGTKWEQAVLNRKRMLEVCPDVRFHISCTVSLYNVLHITDFHRQWAEQGLIRPVDWHSNILMGPRDRRVDVLPPHLKDIAREKILLHIEWLNTCDQSARERCIPGYEAIIRVMDKEDRTDLIPEFYRINDPLDEWRKEKFDDVFPELTDMRKYQ